MNWIFAYGSLIWRPGFRFAERRRALVRGWRRGFWQASPDHRGVPGAPGRVVTLVSDASALCWGAAFRLQQSEWREVISALDIREQNGYELVELEAEFDDGTRAQAVTYIAGPDNPSFVGPAPLAAMVAQIAAAKGPSGSNREYLVRLAQTLSELEIHDEEVHSLHDALIASDQQ